MEKLPKLAIERLKVATPVADHPDADVLTAFSERSLAELERATVLEHLARCGECREILALSLPASEVMQPVFEPSAESGFSWRALRWGFVTAGIFLVAGVGFLQYRKHNTPTMMAYQTTAPVLLRDESQKKSTAPEAEADAARKPNAVAIPLPSETKPGRAAATAVAPSTVTRRDEPASGSQTAAGAGPNAFHGSLAHGPKLANQFQTAQQQTNSYSNQPVPAAPSPFLKQPDTNDTEMKARAAVTAQNVAVSGAAGPVATQSDNLQALVVNSQALSQQQLNGGQAESKVDRAKPAGIAIGSGAKVPARSGPAVMAGTLGGPLPAANARWSISSAGGLQRSFDQGTTWQDVDVAQGPAAAAANLTLASNERAKELDAKDAGKKLEKNKATGMVFRAVSANGADVWAGGASGMLYHSTDAGVTWTRVIASTAGAALTGEILTVAFSDAQHGRISTSTSELWTTDDGGQTWQKQ